MLSKRAAIRFYLAVGICRRTRKHGAGRHHDASVVAEAKDFVGHVNVVGFTLFRHEYGTGG